MADVRLHDFALFVFTARMADVEAEYGRRDNDAHGPAIARAQEFRSVRRYVTVKADTPASTLPPYLIAYQLGSPGVDSIKNAPNGDVCQNGTRPGSDASTASSVRLIYRPVNRVVMARDVPGASLATRIPGKKDLQSYALLVMSNAMPGQDAAYDRWYSDQHVPDVLRIPGFVSGQRYVLDSICTKGVQVPRYMVLFTFQSYDLDATINDLKARNRTGVTKMSPAFNTEGVHVYYYRILGHQSGDHP